MKDLLKASIPIIIGTAMGFYTCDLSGNEINIVEVMTVKMADAIIEADKEQTDG